MKKFQIYSDEQLIGESDLEFHDSGMGVYSGYMDIAPGYNNVRSVFRIFSYALDLSGNEQTTQLELYYRARDDLRLAIKSQDGKLLLLNWVHIIDLNENPAEIQVEASLKAPLDKY